MQNAGTKLPNNCSAMLFLSASAVLAHKKLYNQIEINQIQVRETPPDSERWEASGTENKLLLPFFALL